MAVLPIDLPPGMMRNGTPYGARGRWVDGNLVRWHDGSLRPIGGWQRRTLALGAVTMDLDPTEICRDAISYRTNAGLTESVYFTNKRVFRLTSGNELIDITPVDYPQGPTGPSEVTGYGVGPYGREAYGTRRTGAGIIIIPAARTRSDMWGENVLFVRANEGALYEYAPGDAAALAIATAPTDLTDIIVTDQRIVMGIRNTPEIRELVWSDREDNTEWTPTPTNYADTRRLQGTGNLIGLYKTLNQVLVLSETDAHVGRFLGAPFVYGFERVGTGCGPINRAAVAKSDRLAIWWGFRNFWVYDGTLRKLPCDVMDFLVGDVNRDMLSKIHTVNLSDFSEVWWFYQSINGAEVDSYVAYDYSEGHWSTGRLARTVGFDRGAYSNPIMVTSDGIIYNHEMRSIKVEGEAFAETGPLELDAGGRNMAVRYVFPDTERPNDVELSFKTRQMPTAADVAHGPYPYVNPISTTGVAGREVRMRVKGLTNSWEVGTMRFDVQEVGGGFR